MPELPEVELAAEQLRAWVGTIDAVRVLEPRALREQTPAAFVAALEGATVGPVERLGKHLLAHLGDGATWWIHLGMSGRLVRRRERERLPAATRWAIRSRDQWVGLVDARIFGRSAAGDRGWIGRIAKLDALGPDARSVDAEALAARLAGTRRSIKVALMDQALVAGLGNIQVAEALFRAGIHPKRSARSLDEGEVTALVAGVRGTLEDTLRDLRAQAEERGEVTYMSDGGDNPFAVYGREGEPCARCGHPIARIVQGGRSTFYCPGCQPEQRS